MRCAALLLLSALLVAAEVPKDVPEPVEATVSALTVRPETRADDVLVAVVEVEVLDAAGELPARITLRFAGSRPAWVDQRLPARRLLLQRGAQGWEVQEDLGPVEPARAGEPVVAPRAPEVDELAAHGAEIALGEAPVADERPLHERPLLWWAHRRSTVRVLDVGETLLVHDPDGGLEPGGADHDGRLVMVVAADDRFAVISGIEAAVGDHLELVQEVLVDDGP